jgi:preprotein translocase subunit SecB
MPDTTDMGKSLLVLAATVSPRVQIEGVRLSRCRATSTLPKPETSLQIEFGFDGEATADREDNRIAVVASLMVRAGTPEGVEPPAFKIEAQFILDYKINSFDGISEEELIAFGKVNGVFNVWPYCREYIQSMTTRMGYQALALPVLTGEAIQRIYAAKKAGTKTEGDSAQQPTDAASPTS